MSKIFKPRRGTENTMKTVKSNTVLAAGELFAEVPNTGQGTGKGRLVMGDGVTAYGNLPSFLENVDVSSAQVTVTADNSATSTAAINNVSSGATTGALIGSLKQAISLTKSELTNTIDEVYQAALEAGSGGIRFNDTTNRIQLMDTNKNWVDWKYYNPNKGVEHIYSIANSEGSLYTSQITATVEGLYIVMVSSWSGNGTVTVNSLGSVLSQQRSAGMMFGFVYAYPNCTISVSSSTSSSDTTQCHACYLLRGYTQSTTLQITTRQLNGGFSIINGYNDNSSGNFMCGIAAAWNKATFSHTMQYEGNLISSYSYTPYGTNKLGYSFVVIPDSENCSVTFTNSTGYNQMGLAYGILS